MDKKIDDNIRKLAKLLEDSDNIVFFGGAGVSTESGIPDFRSADGLYKQKYAYPPEEVLSSHFLYHKSDIFFDLYKSRLIGFEAEPNPAHYALVTLEKMGKLKALITQNIDGLHERAGSKNVITIHGTSLRNYCVACGREYDVDFVKNAEGIPLCTACKHMVRPDVVFFGESLNFTDLSRAAQAISKADVLIVAGTSLVVYPAAGLVDYYEGNKLVLINKTETKDDYRSHLIFRNPVGQVLGEAVRLLDK